MFNDITDLLTDSHVPETSDVIIESGRLEWYRIEKDFVLPLTIGGKSSRFANDLNLKSGDIIGLCSCAQTWDKNRYQRVNMCFYYSRLHPIGLTKDFFIRNPIIFTNVTTERNRNKKIDEIIN